MGSTSSNLRNPPKRSLLIHGHANSGVDSAFVFFRSKLPAWNGSRNQATAPFTDLLEAGTVLFDEYNYFGRGRAQVIRNEQGREQNAKFLKAIVLMVDASNLENAFTHHSNAYFNPPTLASVRDREDWISTMLNYRLELLLDRPILILVNKCDKPNAVTAEQVRDRLLSKHLTGVNIRVQECSIMKNKGLEEGWQWLSEQLKGEGKLKTVQKTTGKLILFSRNNVQKAKTNHLKQQIIHQLTVSSIDRSNFNSPSNSSAGVTTKANSTAKLVEETTTSTPTTSKSMEKESSVVRIVLEAIA